MAWILLTLATLLGLLVYLLVTPSPLGVTGSAHPQIPGMNIGGNGLDRLGGQAWALVSLQYVALVFIYLLIALGVTPNRRTGWFWLLLGLGFAISCGICWAMMSSYLAYIAGNSTAHWLGYPLPTALMLFGVFPGGLYLCWLYWWGFSRFIYTPEDEQAYAQLLEELR